MTSQFSEWLSLASRDGRGGASAQPPSIVRGYAWSADLNLNDHPIYGDWTDGEFTAVLKAAPDASTALATWDISVGTPASGVTPVTFTLPVDSQDDLPPDGDGDGVNSAVMQVTFTPTGGVADPIIHTIIQIAGSL